MTAPKEILTLVERFDRSREAYLSGEYNETQLRREFLDPFFKALGWDVENTQGYAEPYKDVVHEDAIKIGTVTKAPDYSFRIGGVRKFFVEAKKPAVNVKEDISPAYQLRRYAWSAKLPLSILTDFEEFAVYDCRVRPLPTDKSSTNRTIYLRCTDYETKWDEIADVFSKDAVLKGSFDKYAETNKRKRGTAEVDDAFLHEIEEWRTALAVNIALRNTDLSQRELNFAVQRTIDRIIFLRICEDRGIETYGALMSLQNGERIYKRLIEMFHRADERYNSGLFHFRPEKERNEPPDKMTLGLDIDDKPLKEIIKSLYYPHSPYEFSVLPADILGQVYEQFLGKVIRLTAGHRAVVEDKPEVKKAGGVYYTPTYIVEYIVKNTVGRLLGDGVQGLGYGAGGVGFGVQNKGGAYGTEVVPGIGGVAEGDATGGGSVSSDLKNAEGGTIRADQSNPSGGGLDSGEHSRGLRQGSQEGISESPFDSTRLADGTGNAFGNSGSTQLDSQGRSGGIGGVDATGRQDAHASHPIPPHLNPIPHTPHPASKTPKQVSKLRILDPACGSGSFLIGAYQYLLEWHRDWYMKDGPEKWAKGKSPALYQATHPSLTSTNQAKGGDGGGSTGAHWRLTTTERKRILLNNIYGVDIDAQAVETTKLSLLLKVLEGENEQTISRQFKMFHERALPDLASNIKCGNSLIGPDFYDGQLSLMDDNERMRINVFDWKKEFKEIMDAGGFDAVIGNPPYIQSRSEQLAEADKGYFMAHYETHEYQLNTYGLFIERSHQLLRQGGLFGMIIPNYWLSTRYDKKLRRFLFYQNRIVEIINVYRVFSEATVDTLLLLTERPGVQGFPAFFEIKSIARNLETIGQRLRAIMGGEYSFQKTYEVSEATEDIVVSFTEQLVLKGDSKLGEIFVFRKGMQPYELGKGTPPQTRKMMDERVYHSTKRVDKTYVPLLRARNVKRFLVDWQGDWIKYGPNLAAPRDPAIFDGPRILLQRIVSSHRMLATFIDSHFVCNTDVITLKPKNEGAGREELLFYLGILSSPVVVAQAKSINVNLDRAAFPKINMETLEDFPVPDFRSSDPVDKARHDKMVGLVGQMLELNKKLAVANTAHEKTALQRQIDAADKQIDELVYELYGLTEEERRIVDNR